MEKELPLSEELFARCRKSDEDGILPEDLDYDPEVLLDDAFFEINADLEYRSNMRLDYPVEDDEESYSLDLIEGFNKPETGRVDLFLNLCQIYEVNGKLVYTITNNSLMEHDAHGRVVRQKYHGDYESALEDFISEIVKERKENLSKNNLEYTFVFRADFMI